MKKVLFIIALMLVPILASADDNGSCGLNVRYSYNEDEHVLTISGTGSMKDYFMYETPWSSYKDDITEVIIETGVTSIGNYSFTHCSGLISLTIPEGVVLAKMPSLFATVLFLL